MSLSGVSQYMSKAAWFHEGLMIVPPLYNDLQPIGLTQTCVS